MLNRDVKQYGKKYMFDYDEQTCWNSDQVQIQLFPIPSGILVTRYYSSCTKYSQPDTIVL